ncbi:adenosine deaminase CECR1-A [Podospora australis]|uniref:adenosine deaminase n=1 Tax=Podospora australis TaxID=1536484 RepID=A0AAN6WZQ3_9PEZI|nr:adenosine deaminase CECR1-A [Podospora australis]
MAKITNEEWAEIVAEELPQRDEPVIQKYLQSRNALMAEELKHRSATDDGRADYTFRQALSPIAREACDIVARIRDEEKKASKTITTPTPRGLTKSWKIMQRMPKGALLRAQCDAVVDIDDLVDIAFQTPGMHISSPDGHLATADARRNASVHIRFRTNQTSEETIWRTNYKPGTWILLTKAADDFPQGGRQGFHDWLKTRCGISQAQTDVPGKHPLGPTQSGMSPGIIRGMLHYEPIWRKFLQRFMSQLVQDGIFWAELRLILPLEFYRTKSESPEPDYSHVFGVIGEEVAKFKATDPGRPFWGLRIIWSTMRGQDSRLIIEDADNCIATKIAWPQLVAGYDLAGPEDRGRPLSDLLPELFWFRKQCALDSVQIPFFFGAGNGHNDATEDNLFDSLLLGTRRIGNAHSLLKHPRLVEAIKDKRILVESCFSPIYEDERSIATRHRHHPLPVLLAQGVPCALGYDDAVGPPLDGVTLGMTHIFWTALHAWDSLGLAGLGSLAENSVRWAAFEDQAADKWLQDIRAASTGARVKANRLKQWAIEWEKFCLWIVTEYGDSGDDALESSS